MDTDKRIKRLKKQIDDLETQLEAQVLLNQVWAELGPYTMAISDNLRRRIQTYFEFDDSE